MRIPNYDVEDDVVSNFRQLYNFMPHQCFRMLVCGPSGSGKTNTLIHMIYNLLYFDKVYLYAKNLEQSKYQNLMDVLQPISDDVGYDVIEARNDDIIPVEDINSDSQKIVIFGDFVCDKNQKPLVDYFIRGRHKNCSVIYLSQSYYKTPKDIRLNCSHFSIYDFPSTNEKSLICRENGVPKESYEKATKEPYSFIYIDTVPLKSKLTVPRASSLETRYSIVLSLESRGSSLESRVSSCESRKLMSLSLD